MASPFDNPLAPGQAVGHDSQEAEDAGSEKEAEQTQEVF